ncbi:hypothetical protein [Nocardioides sp. AX2bis]|uniref:hypothetical protein n=1 Tax=Nocardioides sp. AX2bis TaxID=2653157 RepID=UPI0012F0B724|nr:hypothetical protein [Nocardioides sp. AX2bis]VXC54492.1 O-antigen/teichoic acid export membrane protein [Nocardioides sp. AX2bis]
MTETLTPRTDAADDQRSGLRKVAALSASLVGTYAVTSALGMVFWLIAARQFPIASVGVAGAAVSTMLLLGTLGTCGLGTLLIARLPLTDQGRRRVLVRTALAVAAAGGLVLGAVVPLAAIILFGVADLRSITGTPGTATLFAVGCALMAVSIVVDQAVLVIGNGNLQLERNTLASAAKVVALIGLVLLGETGGMAIFLAWTLGTLVTLPLVAWRTRGGRALADPGTLLDRTTLRGLGGQALSHHSLNTALQAPLQLLPLLVLIGVSAQSNGVFSTALQVTGVIFALPFAIAVALFASARGSERDIVDRMRLTLPLSLAISVAANLVLFPLAGFVLSLFGAEYSAQGVEVLRLLALAGLPIVVKDHFVALRRVQGRTTEATAVLVVMAAFELAAAAIGMALGGVVGLCAWWLGALVVQALVLSWPLLSAARQRHAPPTAPPTAPDTAPDTAPHGIPHDHTTPIHEDPVPLRHDDTLPPHLADGSGAEDEHTSSDAAPRGRARRAADLVGAGPALVLMTLGLLPIALAVTRSRDSGSGSTALDQGLYVAGLVVIFAPAAVGVLLPRVSTATRVILAVAMMVLLQLTRWVVDPVRFVQHNELIHLNGLRQIEQSGTLYNDNPLLPVTSFYPGLQVLADAVHDLTGLGNHVSGIVVLLVVRVVLALSVLLVVGWVTRSARIGAAAVVVYACNPQMLVFNATFNYQSLALPLAAFVVYLVLSRRRGSRFALVPAVLALWAVIASHHLTPLLLIGAFVVWALVELVLRRGRPSSVGALLVMVAAGVVGFGVTLLNPGNPLLGYLGEIANSSIGAVTQVAGGGESRKLFQNSAGVQSAPWERYAILASLVITLVVLLVSVWRARVLLPARNAIVVLLLAIALVFPVIPASHLTVATAEVGDRSAGFVFFGVGFVVAWWMWQRPMRLSRAWVLGLGASVVFVGSIVLGSGSITNQLPGPFRVSDDARTIDADNLSAADWMAENLPDDSVVYGDRVGGLLAAAYGDQYVVRHVSTRIDASRLLLDPEFGPEDVALVQESGIRYLVADRRNANGLPNQDVYIESGEFGEDGRTEPVPAAALRKFSSVPGVDAIYDNGSIVIYDLGALDAN